MENENTVILDELDYYKMITKKQSDLLKSNIKEIQNLKKKIRVLEHELADAQAINIVNRKGSKYDRRTN